MWNNKCVTAQTKKTFLFFQHIGAGLESDLPAVSHLASGNCSWPLKGGHAVGPGCSGCLPWPGCIRVRETSLRVQSSIDLRLLSSFGLPCNTSQRSTSTSKKTPQDFLQRKVLSDANMHQRDTKELSVIFWRNCKLRLPKPRCRAKF